MDSGYHSYIGCNHLTKQHHIIFQGEKSSVLDGFDFSCIALKSLKKKNKKKSEYQKK